MSARLPEYFTSLAPFRDWFGQGLPILTYHKLGPRPTGTRLKGLYVETSLFSRQLAELRAAGFKSASLDNLNVPPQDRGPAIVLTFDDGFRNTLEYGLAPLAEHGFHAIQFLVADRLGQTNEWDLPAGEVPAPLMDMAQVRDWLSAGHQIGSHTLTHPWLTRLPLAQAREEISASKKKLEDEFGVAIAHFCYPYGDWSEAVRDLVAEAGYVTACTTEFGVNPPGAHPLALQRVTARYRSRNWKNFKLWLRSWF
ncbi:MAG: polysaccharide deacetylase family protein [Verrucomicrobia bacterium]|nr:polysaccharide deacetylase family protein [Verrucomicrobiota bacterium]